MDILRQISAYALNEYLTGLYTGKAINSPKSLEYVQTAHDYQNRTVWDIHGMASNPALSDILGQIRSYGEASYRMGLFQGKADGMVEADIYDFAPFSEKAEFWRKQVDLLESDIKAKLS